ncbi:MAG TPA: sugar ABC transporter ATP-binding protein [Acidimicrobiales bacterium]|nr:sugar ABC transporter ATP-binding protein [Acidimicrobiales bacterium]
MGRVNASGGAAFHERLKASSDVASGPVDDGARPPSRPAPEGASAMGGTAEPLLVMEHVSKAFGAVRALVDVSLELYAGETHGLVGENGAGKSTLVKVLAGVHPPDAGALRIGGREVFISSPAAARDAGIAVIYQEPTLFPDLTVAENIFMSRQPLRSGRRIDSRVMNRRVLELVEPLGVRLDPQRIARGLSIADQQIVEIAKALSLDARVIIMDEPTAALSAYEVQRLFRVVETLRASGAAVLFISHRLEEVFGVCQRVTVMRDGQRVLSSLLQGLTSDDLVRAMVGRDVVEREQRVGAQRGDVVLEVDRLTREGVFVDVSFQVRSGEIVALAGLVGAGRSEVARAVFGIDRYDAGEVRVGGKKLKRGAPVAAMEAGVGLVPEDRRLQGLIMELSIGGNIALPSLARLQRFGLVRRSAEHRYAEEWATRLSLRYGRFSNRVSTLSGGNQQKCVLAKWLSRRPRLLIIDEPTRGIDVATKSEVHRLLVELAEQGVAVLMISSELPEVLRVADRVLVMREGRLVAEFSHDDASEEAIVAAATGQADKVAS